MIILITNTIVPYCYDVAHVLGLPINLSHRFRYRDRWIKKISSVMDVKGQRALVVLRNSDTAELIPLRFVVIEDVLTVGDVNYIELRLQEYFPISLRVVTSQKINEVLTREGFENKSKQPLECLVFEVYEGIFGDVYAKLDAHKLEGWSEILGIIGEFECYKEFGFLNIIQIRTSDGSKALIEKDETGKFSYVLKPGTLYFLEVIQYVPWEIGKKESIESPYDVELKSESDEITLLRKIQRVVGKYDLLRFIFKTPSGYIAKNTFLEVENKQGGDISKYGLPALFLPIRIQPPPWLRFIYGAQIGVAALAMGVLFASDPLANYLNMEAGWIRALALLLIIVASKKWDEAIKEVVKGVKDIKFT